MSDRKMVVGSDEWWNSNYSHLNLTDEEKEHVLNLERTLSDGCYDLSTDKIMMFTGKRGYINFDVLLMREVNNYGHSSDI